MFKKIVQLNICHLQPKNPDDICPYSAIHKWIENTPGHAISYIKGLPFQTPGLPEWASNGRPLLARGPYY